MQKTKNKRQTQQIPKRLTSAKEVSTDAPVVSVLLGLGGVCSFLLLKENKGGSNFFSFNFVRPCTVLCLSTRLSHATTVPINFNRTALSCRFLVKLVAVTLALECDIQKYMILLLFNNSRVMREYLRKESSLNHFSSFFSMFSLYRCKCLILPIY